MLSLPALFSASRARALEDPDNAWSLVLGSRAADVILGAERGNQIIFGGPGSDVIQFGGGDIHGAVEETDEFGHAAPTTRSLVYGGAGSDKFIISTGDLLNGPYQSATGLATRHIYEILDPDASDRLILRLDTLLPPEFAPAGEASGLLLRGGWRSTDSGQGGGSSDGWSAWSWNTVDGAAHRIFEDFAPGVDIITAYGLNGSDLRINIEIQHNSGYPFDFYSVDYSTHIDIDVRGYEPGDLGLNFRTFGVVPDNASEGALNELFFKPQQIIDLPWFA